MPVCLPKRTGYRESALGSVLPKILVFSDIPFPLSSGKLVIKDHHEHIVLRTRHILIDDGGELHAGSALCPFEGNFSIVLYGRWDDFAQGSSTAIGSDGK